MSAFEKHADDVTSGCPILPTFQKLCVDKKNQSQGNSTNKKLSRLGAL